MKVWCVFKNYIPSNVQKLVKLFDSESKTNNYFSELVDKSKGDNRHIHYTVEEMEVE